MNEIGSAHDANEIALAYDRDPLNAMTFEQHRDFREGCIFRCGHSTNCHDLIDAVAMRLGKFPCQPGSGHHRFKLPGMDLFGVNLLAMYRSASLSTPTTLPSSSITGSALTSLSFTVLTATRPALCAGSQSINRSFGITSFFLQSPYIARNSGSNRTLPGSKFLEGCRGHVPAGYGT